MREKKLPSYVVIMGRKVEIKQVANATYMGDKASGLCDYDARVIYLEKNMPYPQKIETLSHECVHFFLVLTGISQKLTDAENEIYAQLFTALFNDLKKII